MKELTALHGTLFVVASVVLLAGCHTAIRPPTRVAVGDYCLEGAQEADARALRQRSLGIAALGSGAAVVAAAPFVAASNSSATEIIGSGLALTAVATAIAGHQWLRSSEHETAIATSFASCIGSPDEEASFARAQSIYQLWIRPDVSRSELVRRATAVPMVGPPSTPPPWADEPNPPPKQQRHSDIIEARLFIE